MNKHHNTVSTGVASATQTQVPATLKPLLKVALDVHLALYVAAIQEEGAHPKAPQRFKPADFLRWIDKQLARAAFASSPVTRWGRWVLCSIASSPRAA